MGRNAKRGKREIKERGKRVRGRARAESNMGAFARSDKRATIKRIYTYDRNFLTRDWQRKDKI